MKKTMKKMLAALLSGAMVLSLTTFSVSGSEGTGQAEENAIEIVNDAFSGDGHVHTARDFVRIETQDATCEWGQMDAYIYTCATCGQEFALIYRAANVENRQPALGHDLENPETIESGCGTYQIGTCKRCGKIDAINGNANHKWDVWHISKQPTCKEGGIVEKTCSTCGLTITEEMPCNTSHNITEWDRHEPTCTEAGYEIGRCKDCGYEEKVELPAKGHRYSYTWTVEQPTCTEEGRQYRMCPDCEAIDTSTMVTIPAKGHCVVPTNDCTKDQICARCGEIVKEGETEHQFSTEWSHDASGHYHACLNEGCKVRADEAAHTGSVKDGDCTKGIDCTICGGVGAGNAQHDFENGTIKRYTYDTHITTCATPGCTVTKVFRCTEGEHTDCTKPIYCKYCNNILKDGQKRHNLTSWTCTEEYHERHCRNLNCQYEEKVAHVAAADDGDCTTAIRCTECRTVLTPACAEHNYSDNWTGDYQECQNPGCTVRNYKDHDGFDAASHNYVNGKCTVCGQVGEQLGGHSLTLDGNIGVNFYLQLNDTVFDDEGAYILFDTTDTESRVPVSEGVEKEIAGNTYYVYTFLLAPKQVNTEITTRLVLSDGSMGQEYTYSVQQYAQSIERTEQPDNVQQLVNAMMEYGNRAESYFTNGTASAPSESVSAEELKDYQSSTTNALPEGVTYSGSTLLLKDTITVRHYFNVDDTVEDPSAYNLMMNGDGRYYVEQSGIAAKDMDSYVECSVGDYIISYSPMNYIRSVLNSSNADENLKNLVTSLYLYNRAATAN